MQEDEKKVTQECLKSSLFYELTTSQENCFFMVTTILPNTILIGFFRDKNGILSR